MTEVSRGIRLAGESAWVEFFDKAVQEKAMQITACTSTEQLLQLQAKVAGLQEMKQLFVMICNKKPSPQ